MTPSIFHFVGIGGIGMSALARFFHSRGFSVSGSDSSDSSLLRDLATEGIRIFPNHEAKNIPKNLTTLIFSEAIPVDNPERAVARDSGIPEKSYFAALGDISRLFPTIAVCGTHGKSTTTAMTGLALETVCDPLVIVGTNVFQWGQKNIRFPKHKTDFFLVEACEYRRSFLHLSPQILLITNCEPDHLDYFQTEKKYFTAFSEMVAKVPEDGTIIVDFTDPHSKRIMQHARARVINSASFSTSLPEMLLAGAHNRRNAEKVLALFFALDFSLKAAQKIISVFTGTQRRFEKKGEQKGILVFDDYAHHPTEICASLLAFREKFPEKKLWVIFQPHQFSRTRDFFHAFGNSFSLADRVLIPNIYRVRDTDEDVASVSAEDLAREIGEKARWTRDFETTVALLRAQSKSGDVIITMGAGPVFEVGEAFLLEEEKALAKEMNNRAK